MNCCYKILLSLSIAFAHVGVCSLSTFAQEPTMDALVEQDREFHPIQESLPVVAPEGAIVLFDNDHNQFLSMSGEPNQWKIDDGCLVSTRSGDRVNHIVSQWHFRDADIHVEFKVDSKGSGNSGIYIHGNYEMQILDSYASKDLTEQDEGSLYGFAKPMVNAAKPAGQWQVYDIRFRAPRRNERGEITEQGSIVAWLNGQLVQDRTRFGEPRSVYHPFRYGTTPYLEKIAIQQKAKQVGPLFLQDHDSPTKFRNVWIKPLDDKAMKYDVSSKK